MAFFSTLDTAGLPEANFNPEGAASALRRHWPLVLALLLVAMWVFVPAGVNPGQWGDNFEQYVWAHSLEWGYHKHPPLPTWLLGGLIALFGPSPYWAYLLAAMCTAGTAFFTYRVAGLLLPGSLVGLSMLAWGLQQAFSMRAQVYNHNTVMMLAVGAAAWCVLQAVHTRALRWWALAGLAAAAGMLSKYQAIVPLGGLVLGLLLTGELARRDVQRGLLLAAGVALLGFAPHLAWMISHDFATLRYASQGGQVVPWSERGLSVLSFLAQQVRLLFPALLFAGLLWLLPGLRVRPARAGRAAAAQLRAADLDLAESPDQQRWRRAWFMALIGFPLVITLLTCPAFGLKLQNHWGFQCLQFVSLWGAWRLRVLTRRPAAFVAAVAVAVQLVAMGWWLVAQAADQGESGRRLDPAYPARALAAAVERDWTRMTACPLKLVVGPQFEAGMISTYLDKPPRVLEGGDYHKSPWVGADELSTHGAVYVATDPADLPEHGVMIDSMSVTGRTAGGRIYWSVVPPVHCFDQS